MNWSKFIAFPWLKKVDEMWIIIRLLTKVVSCPRSHFDRDPVAAAPHLNLWVRKFEAAKNQTKRLYQTPGFVRIFLLNHHKLNTEFERTYYSMGEDRRNKEQRWRIWNLPSPSTGLEKHHLIEKQNIELR